MGRYDKVKVGDRVEIKVGELEGVFGVVGDFDNPEPSPQTAWFDTCYDQEYNVPVLVECNTTHLLFRPYYLINVMDIDVVESARQPVSGHTTSSGMFCVCSSPNVVNRTTALFGVGNEYKYCLNCRKEVR